MPSVAGALSAAGRGFARTDPGPSRMPLGRPHAAAAPMPSLGGLLGKEGRGEKFALRGGGP